MSLVRPPELESFHTVIELPVQWGDQDALGHVNNTVYFRWYESARIAHLAQSGLGEMLSQRGLGPILAAISCNYRRQVKFPDRILVGARVDEARRSSMVMSHVAYSLAQAAVVADGASTVVIFDYATNRPQGIWPELRQRLQEFDPARGADPGGGH